MEEPNSSQELEELVKERMEAKRAADEAFEARLEHCPPEWKGPLADVLDTYEMCVMKMVGITGRFHTAEAIELCRLVLSQKVHNEKQAQAEEVD